MKIQSLSIAVPAACGNDCAFCVANMREEDYSNQLRNNQRFLDLYERDYINRMAYARDNGCNSVMISGNGEPLMNRDFLKFFANCNRQLELPFRQIELQTSGMLLDDGYLRFLRNYIGISVISLSLSGLSSNENAAYNRPRNPKYKVDIDYICTEIKRYDFTLRLSLNLTDHFNRMSPDAIFYRSRELGADQVTFRILYVSQVGSEQDDWIHSHRADDNKALEVSDYIKRYGRALQRLPFGAIKYSVNGISVVVDSDCMATEISEDLKYLVLRSNCKLYSHWDDVGSMIF